MSLELPHFSQSPAVTTHVTDDGVTVTTIYEWQSSGQYWKAVVRDHTLESLDSRYINLQRSEDALLNEQDRLAQRENKTGSIEASGNFSGGYEIFNQPELT